MQQAMSLPQMLEQARQINAAAAAGRITQAQRAAQLKALRAVDEQGRWWSCTPQGGFLVYNGAQWIPAQPPAPAPPQPTGPRPTRPPGPPAQSIQPPARPAQQPPPRASQPAPPLPGSDPGLNNSIVRRWQAFAVTPILALLPGIACGGSWFLYTLLRLNNEGLAGVDLVTPMAIVGLPILLSVLRKPVDDLLRPLQPLRGSFPSAFRWGAALALPVILGLVCSSTATSGYGALNWTAILSILVSYFLIHTPQVRR